MHIRKIRIENVRCFRDGDLRVDLDLTRPDGRLAGWTVLAGRNGSGKTTFLQAALAGFLGELPHLVDLTSWGRRENERWRVAVDIQEGQETEEHVVKWRADTISVGSWESTSWGRLPPGFLVGYGPFRRVSGHASDAQSLMASDHASRYVTLFLEEASLAEAVQWLRDVYLRRLENRPGTRDLESAALRLLQDGLLPGGMVVEKIDSDALWVTQNGSSSIPLTQLSDGYRSVTALVLDIVRHLYKFFGEFRLEEMNGRPVVPYEGVVLIDEIDAHLHVSWQQHIGFWFKEHFPNIQFIVTTHSPFICQAADPRGLIRLPASGERRPAEHVPDDLYHTVVNGTPDDAAMTELFGLEYPFSDHSEALRRRVAELEFKLLREQLTAREEEELARLSEQLPKTGTGAVERALRKLRGE